MGMLSEALNPIKVLGRQARSYASSVGRAGIRASSLITKDALAHGLTYYAIGGAAVGAGLGGYNAYERGTGTVGGALKGAAYGALGGAGLRLGMSAFTPSGMRSIRALGMRLGGAAGGVGSRAARAAGGTNYFRNMATEFKMAGGFGPMGSVGRGMYNRAAGRVGRSVAGAADWARYQAGVGAEAPMRDVARGMTARAARYGSNMASRAANYVGV